PRRAARVRATGARRPSAAARGRRHLDRPRRGTSRVPRPLRARRDDESLPVRRARRPVGRVPLHAAKDRRLPREALARAARPLRPRRRDAAAARRRARRRPCGAVCRRRRARRSRASTAPQRGPAAGAGRRRGADAGGRATSALRSRPCTRRARRTHDRGARRGGARRGRARRRGDLLSAARGAGRVNELALAVYASETGSHLVRPPTDARWRRFLRGFDASGYLERLHAAGLRFVGRSDRAFPPLLAAIHDPPPGLFVRGAAALPLLARPAVAIVGARTCSGYGASVARMLGRELARAGLVVVSGLARGVDGEAHRGALAAGGTTV